MLLPGGEAGDPGDGSVDRPVVVTFEDSDSDDGGKAVDADADAGGRWR